MHEQAEVRERRSSGRRLSVGVVGALLLILSVPGAATASSSADVTTSIEAWHRGSVIPPDHPVCVVGCPPLSFPEAPYPDDTLHVGVAGGFETARTYIVLDLSALPSGRVVTGGTVRLPLAEVDDGTTAPELADILGCAVHGIVEPAQGGPADQAPAVGCTDAASLELDPDGSAFTFDLAPFATGLPASDELAVALVASEEARQGGTWRAVFHGRERAGFDPITARVTYTAPGTGDAAAQPPPPPVPPQPSVGVAERLAPAAPQAGPAPAPPAPGPEEAAEAPAAAPAEEPPAPELEPMAAPLTGGYAYPQVWLLPLAFLTVGGVLARSLALTYEVAPQPAPGAEPA